MMTKRLSSIVAFLVIVVLVVEGYVLFQTYYSPVKKYTGPMEKITLGVEMSLLPSLVWVAENKGYFKENGVEVIIKEFDSGRAAFTAMLNPPADGGSLDIVTTAQTPIVFESFNRSDFAIISTMASSYNDVFVLARRDHGIEKPGDLRGKKIGMTKGSTDQYYLSLFLNTNNIRLNEVEEVDVPGSQLVPSIVSGAVDAISSWQPYIYNAEKALGDKSVVFPTRKVFRKEFYFVSRLPFLQNHPEAVTKFLQALIQAEDFIKKGNDPDNDQDKDEAVDIVSRRLGLDRTFVASTWRDYQFGLFLDQTVIQSFENVAKWAIQNKLTDKTSVPNYLNYISVNILRKVAPGKAPILK